MHVWNPCLSPPPRALPNDKLKRWWHTPHGAPGAVAALDMGGGRGASRGGSTDNACADLHAKKAKSAPAVPKCKTSVHALHLAEKSAPVKLHGKRLQPFPVKR